MAETSSGVTFKKAGKFAARGGMRKREVSNSGSDADNQSSGEDNGSVVKKNRRKRVNPMVQSSKAKRARDRSAAVSNSSSSSDDEQQQRAQLLTGVTYEGSKQTDSLAPKDMGATATAETETDFKQDAQAVFEAAQERIKEAKEATDNVYRGMQAYGQFHEKKGTAAGGASCGFVRKGPIRAPNFLRQSVRWDYQPDLCKDFKETGFCGFGDSCKFMHDRTDYKHGWELEREWNAGRYGKDDGEANKYVVSSDDDDLPFACFLCRLPFTNPVVTKCKHYFCEKCALDNFRKTHKCSACDKDTGGVFNPAKELIARIKGEPSNSRKEAKTKSDAESASDDADEEETTVAVDEDVSEMPDTVIEMLPPPEQPPSSDGENSDADKQSD